MLKAYRFSYQSRSSAGEMVIIEANVEDAWSQAESYFDRRDLIIDNAEGEEIVAGTHFIITTEQRSL